MRTFPDLSDGQLAEHIVTWAGRVAAGEARLLALIGEFDRREAWGGPGLLSCAHWLSWRIGLGAGAARERVRVARALGALPKLEEAFCAGRVSFSQLRAITRVATADDEQHWLDLARHATAGQLERLVRGVRRARRIDEDAADPELAAYRMRTKVSYDEDGTMVITVRLPAEDGAIVTAALEQIRADLDRRQQPPQPPPAVSAETPPAPVNPIFQPADVSSETPPDLITEPVDVAAEAPLSLVAQPADVSAETPASPAAHDPSADDDALAGTRATLAQALIAMARTALDRTAVEHPDLARRTRSSLVVHVDPLTGWGRLTDGEILPPSSLTGITKTLAGPGPGHGHGHGHVRAGRLRRLTAADLTRHDAGRTRRLPTLALRELLGTLDGERCRFPGCSRVRQLHAHHVQYWSDGGGTDLANLLLVCSRPHTLIHQHGFQLALGPDRSLTVATADGAPVQHHPAPPWHDPDELDPTGRIDASTLTPDSIEPRMDLGYAVMVLMQQAA